MTKFCTKCGNRLNLNTGLCPICDKQVKKAKTPTWIIVLAIFFGFGFLGTIMIINAENSINSENNNFEESLNNIEYIKVYKDDLDKDLKNNAAAAKEKYDGKYLEIIGSLGTIDSDLKYIGLKSPSTAYDLYQIHCTITSSTQKEIIKSLSTGQSIYVKGRVTDVGEILGYRLLIHDIGAY